MEVVKYKKDNDDLMLTCKYCHLENHTTCMTIRFNMSKSRSIYMLDIRTQAKYNEETSL